MGIVSIIINFITLICVSLVFYITFLAFNKREIRDETWLQTFKKLWSSDKEVNKALDINIPVYGDIGSFVGQDWGKVSTILIKEADKQDSLMEFIDEGRPNYVGTKSPTV